MKSLLKRLLCDTDGQDLSEYGLALALVGAVAAGAAVAIRNNMNTLWTRGLQALLVGVLGD